MSSLVETILRKVHGYGYSVVSNSERISRHSSDWHEATRNFGSKYTINYIDKVSRPYLEAAFLLRKHEYYLRRGMSNVKSLMHSTDPVNVQSILRINLDWRRVYRCKYGRGVSFTDDSAYGHRHCSGHNRSQAMIVADVLIGKIKTISYTEPMDISFDTAESDTGKVYVKFCDDEFCPRYVIYYDGD
ncbi:zinc finger CCCH-type antiviral protein 1-like [Arctopsyche grandis]|uniref:zinc finger CCCH-type antiviral protein 1-like n=1 Tax=Arctopsyche grandis TaxID=121162 RepID=UPI00406D9F96